MPGAPWRQSSYGGDGRGKLPEHQDTADWRRAGGVEGAFADRTVHMPGGALSISLSESSAATMTGPVTRVCEGVIDMEMFDNET